MFSFAYPDRLFLMLLVPFFVLLYFLARYARSRKLKKFGKSGVIQNLMPDVSPFKPPLKLIIEMASLILIIFAVARPWGGVRDEKNVKEGIEVVIAVDASNSMYASSTADEKGSDRMRTSKLILEKLINRLDNDRVGLIVYAGEAYTLIPVTNDYVSAKMFLNSIDPSQIENQGTDIAAAIRMAQSSFSDDSKIGKAVILITDAEELEDQEGVMAAVQSAAKEGIQIDVVGLGSSTPVPIPLKNGGYMMNPLTGERVMTALNEDLAASIAKEGKGIYVNASNREALNELDKQLDTLKKSSLESSVAAVHDELFTLFAIFALALLILDIFILDRKIWWLDKITFFKKESE
ncbi:MAG: VWA domain-containing protein [Muribaculaceae bacterium]|nr:VWA domain-containing protein [Muribaculaceae bacterium]